jgi:hypothetical protein
MSKRELCDQQQHSIEDLAHKKDMAMVYPPISSLKSEHFSPRVRYFLIQPSQIAQDEQSVIQLFLSI